MSFDPKLVFQAMACAYRNGVLDKVMYIQGHTLQLVMEETGLNLVDLMNRMDETTEDTLFKLDRILEKSAFVCKLATSDFLMKMVSRMLDMQYVRGLIINFLKRSILKVMTDKKISSGEEKVPHWQESSLAGEG